MTLPKPTRPAPEMPAIKQPAPDYRTLLVRYMASVIEAEGISFVGRGDEMEFTPEDMDALRHLEIEALKLLGDEEGEIRPVGGMSVWLRGEQVFDVLEVSSDGDKKSIVRYVRDAQGNLKANGGELVTETVIDDFEFRWTESAAAPVKS